MSDRMKDSEKTPEQLWREATRYHRRAVLFAILAIVFSLLSIFLSFVNKANAAREHPEKWYQEAWCKQRGGEVEFVLPNKTRCDCLLSDYAIEFDFAGKWAEALGQSLHYGMWTGRRAGIVLIVEDAEKDAKYVTRCLHTIQHYGLPIEVWTMEVPVTIE